jgi:hypothetical protein
MQLSFVSFLLQVKLFEILDWLTGTKLHLGEINFGVLLHRRVTMDKDNVPYFFFKS